MTEAWDYLSEDQKAALRAAAQRMNEAVVEVQKGLAEVLPPAFARLRAQLAAISLTGLPPKEHGDD